MKKFSIFLLIFATFFSCKTAQKSTSSKPKTPEAATIFNAIRSAEPKFSTINISKMAMEVNLNGQNFFLHGALRTSRDSTIIISLQPLSGFEMARMEFFPKKFRIINKLGKTYFEAGYEYINRQSRLKISFQMLHDVIERRIFVLGRELDAANLAGTFLVENSDTAFHLRSASADGAISHHFAVSGDGAILDTDLSVFLEGSSAAARYRDETTHSGVKFPDFIEIDFNGSGYKFLGKFNINKIAFNKEIDLSPTSLERFERVTFQQLFSK